MTRWIAVLGLAAVAACQPENGFDRELDKQRFIVEQEAAEAAAEAASRTPAPTDTAVFELPPPTPPRTLEDRAVDARDRMLVAQARLARLGEAASSQAIADCVVTNTPSATQTNRIIALGGRIQEFGLVLERFNDNSGKITTENAPAMVEEGERVVAQTEAVVRESIDMLSNNGYCSRLVLSLAGLDN